MVWGSLIYFADRWIPWIGDKAASPFFLPSVILSMFVIGSGWTAYLWIYPPQLSGSMAATSITPPVKSDPPVSPPKPAVPPDKPKNPNVLVQPVYPSAHIEVFSGDELAPNQRVFGIPWRADLMDVWVILKNSSGDTYQDLAASILMMASESQTPIRLGFYEIAPVEGPPCTTHLGGKLRFTAGLPGFVRPEGRPSTGLDLNSTTDSVYINCDKLNDGAFVKFLVAVTNYPTGQKVKPAVFGIQYDYTVNQKKYTWKQCEDSLDMDKGTISSPAKPRTVEELKPICGRLAPGDKSAQSGPFNVVP
jgi:hypothetical protein